MSFWDLFLKSWGEYKENFRTTSKIFFLFGLLPFLFILLVSIFLFKDTKDFLTNILASSNSFILISSIISIAVFVIFYITMILSYSYLFIFTEKKTKTSFGQSIKGGLSFFWGYIKLSLLLIILLAPFLLPLIISYEIMFFLSFSLITIISFVISFLFLIPFIILSVYWLFSPYVLIRENTGAWESMKRSKIIIKGRWWKVFGYIILNALIMLAISIPFGIFEFVINLLSLFMGGSVTLRIIGGIISSFSSIITIPLSVAFFKNFYFDLRKDLLKKSKS